MNERRPRYVTESGMPLLNAIAIGIFTDPNLRNWLIEGTPSSEAYVGANILTKEHRTCRWAKEPRLFVKSRRSPSSGSDPLTEGTMAKSAFGTSSVRPARTH